MTTPETRRRDSGRRRRVIPSSTYRLQLRADVDFAEATRIAPYLVRLGVSHVYSSPYLQAVEGSQHGYDVVDPHQVDVGLGGSRAHRRFSASLGQRGLGQILDIVPNHMAIIGSQNPWWWDVLENGPSSRYARYFDVEWDPPEARDRNQVLLPILGDHYGRIIEAGELRLERTGARFRLRYHEHLLPLSPRSLDTLLARAATRSRSAELAFVADALRALPRSTSTDQDSLTRRHRDKQVLLGMLARVLDEQPRARTAVDEILGEIETDADALDELLMRQNYRIAFWRAAGRDLGYRRFFDISSLIGLRVEDPLVFDDAHALVLRWIDRGVLDGIRVDHPDGLYDPAAYLKRLRAGSPRGWIVVEKILMPGEDLPREWPVDGTTGYDFLRDVTNLLIDARAEPALTALNARISGDDRDFETISRETRHLIVRDTLGSDLNRLAAEFLEICERHRRFRDYTRHELHEAIREMLVGMPVYRTYVRPQDGYVAEVDRAIIDGAVQSAAAARDDIDAELFAFLGDILALRVRGDIESDLAGRFQQLSSAVMAKGVEDTAFYRYHRLTALNDVGGDPGRFGMTTEAFHAANRARAEHWPGTMLTTSTHDTKRSEDVRARLAVISEMPARWDRIMRRWMRRFRRTWQGTPFDSNIAYLAAQTIVGAWPIDAARLGEYLRKAAREARQRTSWTEPDAAYEAALEAFATAILEDRRFLADLAEVLPALVRAGRVNSLAQLLLKLTSPGVPDIYGGTELWDLSLVDPDNRRAVDFAAREAALAELEAALERDPGAGPGTRYILERIDSGLPKLWLMRQVLHLRTARPDLFGLDAAYEPLPVAGTARDHVVAYLRGGGAATVVPRLPLTLSKGRMSARLLTSRRHWGDTRLDLPAGQWRDALSGARVRVHAGVGVAAADLLGAFPVALLVREADGPHTGSGA